MLNLKALTTHGDPAFLRTPTCRGCLDRRNQQSMSWNPKAEDKLWMRSMQEQPHLTMAITVVNIRTTLHVL